MNEEKLFGKQHFQVPWYFVDLYLIVGLLDYFKRERERDFDSLRYGHVAGSKKLSHVSLGSGHDRPDKKQNNWGRETIPIFQSLN